LILEPNDKRIEFIKEKIPKAACYEQMAEECCELAQALLKKARKLRGENYTPKSNLEINKSIIEELTDVILCGIVLDIHPSRTILNEKLNRWVIRNKGHNDDSAT